MLNDSYDDTRGVRMKVEYLAANFTVEHEIPRWYISACRLPRSTWNLHVRIYGRVWNSIANEKSDIVVNVVVRTSDRDCDRSIELCSEGDRGAENWVIIICRVFFPLIHFQFSLSHRFAWILLSLMDTVKIRNTIGKEIFQKMESRNFHLINCWHGRLALVSRKLDD